MPIYPRILTPSSDLMRSTGTKTMPQAPLPKGFAMAEARFLPDEPTERRAHSLPERRFTLTTNSTVTPTCASHRTMEYHSPCLHVAFPLHSSRVLRTAQRISSRALEPNEAPVLLITSIAIRCGYIAHMAKWEIRNLQNPNSDKAGLQTTGPHLRRLPKRSQTHPQHSNLA